MKHEENNPWTRLSTTEIYENPWIKLEEDQVLKPNGAPGIYGRVHFKNKAIGIVALDDSLNTWLVGQYRYTLEEYCWEIPTGGGPLNETPLESAKRELKEETGISAGSWENILRIHTSNSVTDEEGFVFLAKELSYGATEFEDTEDLMIKKLPLQEALDMVMKSEITDSLSIAGLLKVARMLGL